MNKKENNYITPGGFQKLKEERDHLTKIERPEVTKTVTWAASNGDRSENADYQYGKKRLREIDRRLRFLNTRINCAKVIDPTEQNFPKVQFGATVELVGEDDETKIYSIVGVDEIDTNKGHISWRSPLGRSLLGKEEGDIIEVNSPSGEKEFEIQSVKYKEII